MRTKVRRANHPEAKFQKRGVMIYGLGDYVETF
jgi:hypothetical protein